ncbi:MAG: hypothetical protein JXA30_09415 [Deltaproteobacteria bacterium]|nr:hypothetical protein [Deltaproteobacteria bacterium]
MINRYINMVLFSACVLLLEIACARTNEEPHDGQTHWLKSCEGSGDCGDLECVCGFCVQTCDKQNPCAVEGMTTDCKAIDSEAVEALCQAEEPQKRVCLQPCSKDSQCGDGQACIGEACVPVASAESDASSQKPDARSFSEEQGPDASISSEGQEPDANLLSDAHFRQGLLSCLNGTVILDQDVNKIEKIDMLFVVDNSPSMLQEQAKLREQLPRMIKILATGDKTPDDGVENRDFPPKVDLHLAVVSTDMGLPGLAPQENPDATGACNGTGDDGNFLNDPGYSIASGLNCPGVSGGDYPIFLTHLGDTREETNVTLKRAEQTAANFACLATLGTYGCGFEMPLESSLKALWPSRISNLTEQQQSLDISFLAGSNGHGDNEHQAFLRGTPYHPTEVDEISLLAIIVVTDEEDCSAGARGDLDFLSLYYPGGDRNDLNLRCYKDTVNNWGNKYPVDRYINAFKELRPHFPDLVIFSAIAGIPGDIDEDTNGDGEITNDERESYYRRLLSDDRMQEVPDPETQNLGYSCAQDADLDGFFETQAFPARRLTEVARGFGENGMIHSICSPSFAPAIDSIIDVISNKIGGICFPRSMPRDSNGMIDCDVVWTMPPGWSCDDYPFLSSPPADGITFDESGRARCAVDQLPVINPDTDDPAEALDFSYKSGLGWYYDDFSLDMQTVCKLSESIATKQRISFTLSPGMQGANEDPPSRVSIELICQINPSPDSSATELDGLANKWSCDWEGCSEGDFYCQGEIDACVASCQTDADCENNDLPGWTCFDVGGDKNEKFCIPHYF